MPEETQGQAEVEPGAEGGGVASEATPETTEAPQATDYAALEERTKAFGDGYSLSNLPDKYESARREMNEAQRLKIETERRYEPVKPLIEKLQSDPQFAAKLQSAAQEYFGGGGYDQTEVPPEVKTGLDPLVNRLNQMEVQLAGEQMDRDIDKLKTGGMPIDDNVKNQIYQMVVDTGSKDVEAHAWKILGPQMVKQAGQEATKEVAEKIKGNNSKYVNVPGGPAPDASFDARTASQSEVDSEMMKDLEKRMT